MALGLADLGKPQHPLPNVASGGRRRRSILRHDRQPKARCSITACGMPKHGNAARGRPEDRWISIIALPLRRLHHESVRLPAEGRLHGRRAGLRSRPCSMQSSAAAVRRADPHLGMLNAERKHFDLSSSGPAPRRRRHGRGDPERCASSRPARGAGLRPDRINHLSPVPPSTMLSASPLPVGRCRASARVTIRARAPLPLATIRAIEARGPLVMLGYYNKPAEPRKRRPDGWLKPVISACPRRRARVVIAGGRLRDMIIRAARISIRPRSRTCCAPIRRRRGRGLRHRRQLLRRGRSAAVTLKLPARSDDLRGFCDGRIAAQPARFYVVQQFPDGERQIRKSELRHCRGRRPEPRCEAVGAGPVGCTA